MLLHNPTRKLQPTPCRISSSSSLETSRLYAGFSFRGTVMCILFFVVQVLAAFQKPKAPSLAMSLRLP